jgi:hypothetical protein
MEWPFEQRDPKKLVADLSARHVALGASLDSAIHCAESDRACSAVHLRIFAEHLVRHLLEANGEIAGLHASLHASIRSPLARQIWQEYPDRRKQVERLRIAGNDAAHGRKVREAPSALVLAASELAEWLLASDGPLTSPTTAMEVPSAFGFSRPSVVGAVAGDGYFLLRGATETTVLQLNNGEVEIVNERAPYLLFAHGDQLWEWEQAPTRVPVWTAEDLEEFWDTEDDQRFQRASHVPLPDGRLVNVRTGRAVGSRLIEPDAQAPTDQRPTIEQMGVTMGWIRDVQVLPSFGQWILVQETDHTYSGGAHSNWECVFWALDMTTGGRVDLLGDLSQWLASEPDLRQRALQQWLDQADPEVGRPENEELPKFSLTKVAIRFDAHCRPVAVVQLSADECFAFSDGLWSSYTRSVQIQCPELPPAFAAQAQLPAVITHWAQANMPDLMGWSHLAKECGSQLRNRLDHPPEGW